MRSPRAHERADANSGQSAWAIAPIEVPTGTGRVVDIAAPRLELRGRSVGVELARLALTLGVQRWSPMPVDREMVALDVALAAHDADKNDLAADLLSHVSGTLFVLLRDLLDGIAAPAMMLDALRVADVFSKLLPEHEDAPAIADLASALSATAGPPDSGLLFRTSVDLLEATAPSSVDGPMLVEPRLIPARVVRPGAGLHVWSDSSGSTVEVALNDYLGDIPSNDLRLFVRAAHHSDGAVVGMARARVRRDGGPARLHARFGLLPAASDQLIFDLCHVDIDLPARSGRTRDDLVRTDVFALNGWAATRLALAEAAVDPDGATSVLAENAVDRSRKLIALAEQAARSAAESGSTTSLTRADLLHRFRTALNSPTVSDEQAGRPLLAELWAVVGAREVVPHRPLRRGEATSAVIADGYRLADGRDGDDDVLWISDDLGVTVRDRQSDGHGQLRTVASGAHPSGSPLEQRLTSLQRSDEHDGVGLLVHRMMGARIRAHRLAAPIWSFDVAVHAFQLAVDLGVSRDMSVQRGLWALIDLHASSAVDVIRSLPDSAINSTVLAALAEPRIDGESALGVLSRLVGPDERAVLQDFEIRSRAAVMTPAPEPAVADRHLQPAGHLGVAGLVDGESVARGFTEVGALVDVTSGSGTSSAQVLLDPETAVAAREVAHPESEVEGENGFWSLRLRARILGHAPGADPVRLHLVSVGSDDIVLSCLPSDTLDAGSIRWDPAGGITGDRQVVACRAWPVGSRYPAFTDLVCNAVLSPLHAVVQMLTADATGYADLGPASWRLKVARGLLGISSPRSAYEHARYAGLTEQLDDPRDHHASPGMMLPELTSQVSGPLFSALLERRREAVRLVDEVLGAFHGRRGFLRAATHERADRIRRAEEAMRSLVEPIDRVLVVPDAGKGPR